MQFHLKCKSQRNQRWKIQFCLKGLLIPVNGYSFEMESIISANNDPINKLEVVEVPIETVYEEGNPTSHFNPILDSMRIYFVFLRYIGSSLIAAITDNSLFALVYASTGSVAWSQFWGRFVALLISFIILRKVVFKSHQWWPLSLAKYISLVGVFGFISYVIIDFTNQKFGVSIVVAKLMVESVLFITGFAFARTFIFNSKRLEKKA